METKNETKTNSKEMDRKRKNGEQEKKIQNRNPKKQLKNCVHFELLRLQRCIFNNRGSMPSHFMIDGNIFNVCIFISVQFFSFFLVEIVSISIHSVLHTYTHTHYTQAIIGFKSSQFSVFRRRTIEYLIDNRFGSAQKSNHEP